ncbi:GDP-mannose 4,6-dehydratase [Prochlorococcus sp. AH-716-E17]|nr:GDP-mannose 4,6-dehydratase [Prochlorococcus sp. AH-716-E17]
MRVLITGSAGFIGSHLVPFLLAKDIEVIGIDNFATGFRENVFRNKKIYGDKYTFLEGSILDQNLIKKILKGVDIVIHLAAQVSVIKSIENPKETHTLNATAFLEIIEFAKLAKVRKIVYPSSCAVYGNSNNHKLDENSSINPLSIYASTKYLNDLYASNFNCLDGYPNITGLRLFNVFGSFQNNSSGYASVIPIWISRIMNNLNPIIYGDGKSTRDFIHVIDVCKAFYLALINDHLSKNIYNIGFGNSVNLLELLEIMKSVLIDDFKINNREIKPIFKNARIGEIKYSKSDISLAKSNLGFKPSLSLKKGIKEILENQYKLKQ